MSELKIKLNSIFAFLITCRIFCQHNFIIINQLDLMSEFDIVVMRSKVPNTWNSKKRKTVTDFECNKCKKIKRKITETSL